MISLTPTKTVRTWMVQVEVVGAPDTKRDYSDHMVRPEQLIISYRATGTDAPRPVTVRLLGTRVGGPGPRPVGDWPSRVSATWHDPGRLPAWIVPIVQEYAP